MNKTELSFSIANRVGLTQANVENVLEAFTEIVTDRLADGEKVQLFGFGTFDIKEKAPRIVANLQNQTKIQLGARRIVTFKPGKMLKELTKESQNG